MEVEVKSPASYLKIKIKKLEKKLNSLTEELQLKNRESMKKDLKIYDLEVSIARQKKTFEDYKRKVKRKLENAEKVIRDLFKDDDESSGDDSSSENLDLDLAEGDEDFGIDVALHEEMEIKDDEIFDPIGINDNVMEDDITAEFLGVETHSLKCGRKTRSSDNNKSKQAESKHETERKLEEVEENKISPNSNQQLACEICRKCFKSKNILKKHQIVHSDKKQLKCNFCPKRFKRTGDLNRHIRGHSGEKIFSCLECEKAFKRRYELKQHQRKFHQ